MNINEYALELLQQHDCDIHTYGDIKISEEELINDLKTAHPEGLDYDYTDVAKAILEISVPSIDKIPVSGFDFDEWGRYDFDDDTLAELQSAVESGKPFNTGWHGWSKNFDAMQVIRGYDQTVVRCSSEMDEDEDLINDCLVGNECIEDTGIYNKILDALYMDYDFSSHKESMSSLPVNASLDDILAEAKKLFRDVHNALEYSYRYCIGTTLQVLYGGDSEETTKMIIDRIKLLSPDSNLAEGDD